MSDAKKILSFHKVDVLSVALVAGIFGFAWGVVFALSYWYSAVSTMIRVAAPFNELFELTYLTHPVGVIISSSVVGFLSGLLTCVLLNWSLKRRPVSIQVSEKIVPAL